MANESGNCERAFDNQPEFSLLLDLAHSVARIHESSEHPDLVTRPA